MVVKIATTDDIEEIATLLEVLFMLEKEFEPDKNKQINALKTIINNQNIGHILVLKNEGEIVATLSLLYTVSTALGTKVAILEDMIVSPKYRRKGFGTLLLKSALKFAQENGCTRVTLLTDSSNIKAQQFYKKIGFKKSNMIPFRFIQKAQL